MYVICAYTCAYVRTYICINQIIHSHALAITQACTHRGMYTHTVINECAYMYVCVFIGYTSSAFITYTNASFERAPIK